MRLDYSVLKAMCLKSNEIREGLKREALKCASDAEKMRFITSYFLDGFSFDYSVLREENCELEDRMNYVGTFSYDGRTFYSVGFSGMTPDEKWGIALSPSVHALKMGTCAYFSRELLWFAKELGIECSVVNKLMMCYDGYQYGKKKCIYGSI